MKIPRYIPKLSVFVILLVLTLSFSLAITETGTDEGTLLVDSGPVYACQEQWSCFWTECVDNSQTYVCTDTNNCGTNDLEPALSGTTQTCEIITPPAGGGGGGGGSGGDGDSDGGSATTGDNGQLEVDESCEENWICYAWSNVEGKCGERECFDRNMCGTIDLQPVLEKTCETTVGGSRFTSAVVGVTERVLTTPGIYIPLIFVFLVAAGGLTVILFSGGKGK